MTTLALASDLAAALDPVVFARQVGFAPDAWQADVLRSTDPRLILLASRQSGKSSTVALRALHCALFEPGATVLITAAAQRQSTELFAKVVALYRALGRPVPAEAESRLMLELETGARVIALPGRSDATLRGYSAPRLIIADEASRQPPELLHAISPMLATAPRGQLILLSTPAGRCGTFYEVWHHGTGWRRVGPITAEACPRIPRAFLDGERATMPDRLYRQEYLCEFTDIDDAVFRGEDIDAALSPDVQPLFARQEAAPCL